MSTIVLIGPIGTGKGTKTKKAKEVIANLKSISTGDLLRESGFDLSSGKLISDDIVMGLLKGKLEEYMSGTDEKVNTFIILDGVPRNLEQAQLMEEEQIKVDMVLYLPLTLEEALDRAENRIVCTNKKCNATYTKNDFNPPKVEGICDLCGTKLGKREDDNPDTVEKRMKIYFEKTHPLLDWYRNNDVPVVTVTTDDEFVNAVLSSVSE